MNKNETNFNLSDDEFAKASTRAFYSESAGIVPSATKIAVIIAGQPGATKINALNATKKALGLNCVVLDNNSLRNYHPYAIAIKKERPQEFHTLTNDFEEKLMPTLVDCHSDLGLNIIIKDTLENEHLMSSIIKSLKDKDYTIAVKSLAVCDLESLTYMVEKNQALFSELGYYVDLSVEDHNTAYNQLPKTLAELEQNPNVDFIEVLGNSGTEPIYQKVSPAISEDALSALNYKPAKSKFKSAEEALELGRVLDYQNSIETISTRLSTARNRASQNFENKAINKIQRRYSIGYFEEDTPSSSKG